MAEDQSVKNSRDGNAYVVRDLKAFRNDGPGSLNFLTQSKYDFSKTQYPSEGLGTTVPNYVVFYVNLPEAAKFDVTSEQFTGDVSTSDQNIQKTRGINLAIDPRIGAGDLAASTAFLGVAGDVGQALYSGDVVTSAERLGGRVTGKAIGGASLGLGISTLASNIQKKPKMKRIKEAIAIYMPDTVFHTYSHDYDVQSLTSALGNVGLAQKGAGVLNSAESKLTLDPTSGFGIGAAFETVFNPAQGGNVELAATIAERTGAVGNGFTDFALRSQGLAINPQVELMFKGTGNRGFVFDFKFQPKSKKETETIKHIIFLFKRYAAPVLANSGIPGAYFAPPGQFDIQYYFGGSENPYIGKISTCVLENIDVNYSSAGQFASFPDGSPVEINMQLRFKEVDILTRDMIDAGF